MCKFPSGPKDLIRHRVIQGPIEVTYIDERGERHILGRFAELTVEHSRRLVRLAPGELPDPGLMDPDVPGFRLESDAEFRERLISAAAYENLDTGR